MKIFIVGVTGFLGRHVAAHLQAGGHEISGVCRSESAAASLRAAGVAPVIADLDEPAAIVAAAGEADATIYSARLLDEAHENRVVNLLLDRLAGSGKTFIFTSGTAVLGQRSNGEWLDATYEEDDSFEPNKYLVERVETEQQVRAAADRGIRAIVQRPPQIWSDNVGGVHVDLIYQSVRDTGAACYIGRGLNVICHVHVEDLALLYGLILEKGVAGALYHSVAGEIPLRWIAENVARDMQCDVRSVTLSEGIEIWGKGGVLIRLGLNNSTRSRRARDELGWVPTRPDMLIDIGKPHYRAHGLRQDADGTGLRTAVP